MWWKRKTLNEIFIKLFDNEFACKKGWMPTSITKFG